MMVDVSAPLSYKYERENYDLFQDFPDGNLIDTIDFDDLFEGINDGDLLPDLEIFAESSVSNCEESATYVNMKSKSKEAKKSSGQIKNPEGKRKVKVDWTPELHRRFVKAVEKLGVDKAVPSRILELMDTHGLTRHNIASHLQKYRGHQKHLLAREAEAPSLSQRKQMYGGVAAVGGGGKRIMMNPWPAPPTIGFPLMAHHIRPLHVWAHPHVNNSFWYPHFQGASNSVASGTPCFPAPTRFAAPLMVPGIPQPSVIIKVDTISSDLHPSKESIDTAIEDVLSKPQMPLPIGLKPPSIDSVLNELQCQGITKVPPSEFFWGGFS